MLSATNSIKCGTYVFQPTKYDQNDNLLCKIVKRYQYKKHIKDICKLTGVYNFDTDSFNVIYTTPDFLNHDHIKMLRWFLKQYDWNGNKIEFNS
jgi:hypothetical protein